MWGANIIPFLFLVSASTVFARSVLCPYDGIKYPDTNGNCGAYLECVNGETVRKFCEKGLNYNCETKVCVKMDHCCAATTAGPKTTSPITESTTSSTTTESTTISSTTTESTTTSSESPGTGETNSTTGITPGPVSCSNGDKIPSTDCYSYYECVNGKLESRICKHGSYDCFTRTCTYFSIYKPCCSKDSDGGSSNCNENDLKIPNPFTCNKYFECKNNKIIQQTCSDGEKYNWIRGTCETADSGVCAPESNTEPKNTTCLINGAKYPNRKHCQLYDECVDGKLETKKCSFGSFDCTISSCNILSNFRPCCKNESISGSPFCFTNGKKIPNVFTCNKYFECVNNRMKEQTCPSGQKYNWFYGKCEEATSGDCALGLPDTPTTTVTETTATETTPTEPLSCPKNGVKLPHRGDCKSYYECVDGKLETKNCTTGSFNCITNTCSIFNIFKPCCSDEPIPGNHKCLINGIKIPNVFTCNKYYECVDHKVVEQICPAGQKYNWIFGNCENATSGNCAPGSTHTTLSPEPTTRSPLCPQDDIKIPNTADCKSYFQCVNGELVQKTCPIGRVYNCFFKKCTLKTFAPCCKDDTDNSKNQTDWNCLINGIKIPNPFTCNKYFECENHKIIEKSCSSGEKYDWFKSKCVTANNGECQSNGNPPNPLCQQDGIRYPSANDCSAYLECKNGKLEKIKCPTGENYDCRKEKCEHQDVPHCCSSITTEPTTSPDDGTPTSEINESSSETPTTPGSDTENSNSEPTESSETTNSSEGNSETTTSNNGSASESTPSTPSPVEGSNICPIEGAKLADVLDCSGYYVCESQEPVHHTCPSNEEYSCWVQECVPATSADCINNQNQTGQSCTKEGMTVSNTDDCSKYYECTNGKVESNTCEAGLAFNAWYGKCVERSVAHCESSTGTTESSETTNQSGGHSETNTSETGSETTSSENTESSATTNQSEGNSETTTPENSSASESTPSTPSPVEGSNICPIEGAKLADVLDCSGYYVCESQEPVHHTCPSNEEYSCWVQECVPATSADCINNQNQTGQSCTKEGMTVSNTDDCSKYYECTNGKVESNTCEAGLAFNAWYGKCVERSVAHCESSTGTTESSETTNQSGGHSETNTSEPGSETTSSENTESSATTNQSEGNSETTTSVTGSETTSSENTESSATTNQSDGNSETTTSGTGSETTSSENTESSATTNPSEGNSETTTSGTGSENTSSENTESSATTNQSEGNSETTTSGTGSENTESSATTNPSEGNSETTTSKTGSENTESSATTNPSEGNSEITTSETGSENTESSASTNQSEGNSETTTTGTGSENTSSENTESSATTNPSEGNNETTTSGTGSENTESSASTNQSEGNSETTSTENGSENTESSATTNPSEGNSELTTSGTGSENTESSASTNQSEGNSETTTTGTGSENTSSENTESSATTNPSEGNSEITTSETGSENTESSASTNQSEGNSETTTTGTGSENTSSENTESSATTNPSEGNNETTTSGTGSENTESSASTNQSEGNSETTSTENGSENTESSATTNPSEGNSELTTSGTGSENTESSASTNQSEGNSETTTTGTGSENTSSENTESSATTNPSEGNSENTSSKNTESSASTNQSEGNSESTITGTGSENTSSENTESSATTNPSGGNSETTISGTGSETTSSENTESSATTNPSESNSETTTSGTGSANTESSATTNQSEGNSETTTPENSSASESTPSTPSPVEGSNICPIEGAKLADVLDCSGYYVCESQEPVHHTCPSNEEYSCWVQECVPATSADCINNQNQTGQSCTKEGMTVSNTDDCSKYYECTNGKVESNTCEAGLAFNAWYGKCVERSVAHCESSTGTTESSETTNQSGGHSETNTSETGSETTSSENTESSATTNQSEGNSETTTPENSSASESTPSTPSPVEESNICPVEGAKLADVLDCSGYYVCESQEPVHHTCPSNEEYSCWVQECVPATSADCINNQNQTGQSCTKEGMTVSNTDDCSKYYECTNGKVESNTCEAGLAFNAWFGKCVDRSVAHCESSTGTTSASGGSTEPSSSETNNENTIGDTTLPSGITPSTPGPIQESNNCPIEGAKLADVLDCHSYYVCESQKPVHRTCPSNQEYSCWVQECVPANSADCINNQNQTGQTCSNEGMTISNTEDCSKYYQCVNGKVESNVCVSGSAFNAWYEKCVDFSVAHCESSTGSNRSIFCPQDGITLPDVGDCQSYYKCEHGQPIKHTCSSGFVWNCFTKSCSLKAFAPCCRGSSSSSNSCLLLGFKIPNPFTCDKYFECSRFKIIEQQCPSGQKFDWIKMKCVDASSGKCAPAIGGDNSTTVTPPESTTAVTPSPMCPQEGVTIPDESNCKNYFKCNGQGQLEKKTCSLGRVWNCFSKTCTYKIFAPCCKNDPNSSGSGSDFCLLNGFKIPDFFHCNKYYECVRHRITERTCPSGEKYHWLRGKCVTATSGACAPGSNGTTISLPEVETTTPSEGSTPPASASTQSPTTVQEGSTPPASASTQSPTTVQEGSTPPTATTSQSSTTVATVTTAKPNFLCPRDHIKYPSTTPGECSGYFECINRQMVKKYCDNNVNFNCETHTCDPNITHCCAPK